MDTSKTYWSMAYIQYDEPHQYKSLTNILKHAAKYITCNIIHNL